MDLILFLILARVVNRMVGVLEELFLAAIVMPSFLVPGVRRQQGNALNVEGVSDWILQREHVNNAQAAHSVQEMDHAPYAQQVTAIVLHALVEMIEHALNVPKDMDSVLVVHARNAQAILGVLDQLHALWDQMIVSQANPLQVGAQSVRLGSAWFLHQGLAVNAKETVGVMVPLSVNLVPLIVNKLMKPMVSA